MSVNNPSSGSHPAVQLNLCAKIYVQRLSKVSSSRSDLSSELGLKSNHQFDSSTWRPDILRWPKSMSPFSLHKPTYNLLSLTPHQLHYFSCSGQNLRAMFVWIVFFFFRVIFNSCSSPASHPIYQQTVPTFKIYSESNYFFRLH